MCVRHCFRARLSRPQPRRSPEQAAEARALEVAVQDTGSGLPQEDLPKVFDRFFQRQSHAGSGGLGLSFPPVAVASSDRSTEPSACPKDQPPIALRNPRRLLGTATRVRNSGHRTPRNALPLISGQLLDCSASVVYGDAVLKRVRACPLRRRRTQGGPDDRFRLSNRTATRAGLPWDELPSSNPADEEGH
ncbi:MAG: ATP-binding protein [Thermoanaerobaculia bacterium]